MDHVRRYYLCRLAGLLFATLLPNAHAQTPNDRPPGLPELVIVADHGGESALPYFVAISGAEVDEHEGYSPKIGGQVPSMQPYGEQDMLPVTSEKLTPGPVTPRALQLPGGFTPIFLIGNDDLSRQWLAQRGDILRQLHAVGLVVEVEDRQALERLRNEAQGLELRPVSGDRLAGRLGLQHYPVLINQHGIEQ